MLSFSLSPALDRRLRGAVFSSLLTAILLAPLADPSTTDYRSTSSETTVQTAGWPVFDISNLVSAMQTFVQIKQQIDQAAEQYQMLRKNFAVLSDLTGWDTLDTMFAPIDGIVNRWDNFKSFDLASGMIETFFPNEPDSYEGNLADVFSDAGQRIKESFDEQLLNISNMQLDLEKTASRLSKINECAANAEGTLGIERCMVNVGLVQANELSTMKAQLVRQGMYTALRGNNDYVTQRHRKMLINELLQDARRGTLSWSQSPATYTNPM
jgi:hypothetical protein